MGTGTPFHLIVLITLWFGSCRAQSLAETADDTYKRLRPCLSSFGMSEPTLEKLRFPSDAEEHYAQLLEATKPFRTNIPVHGAVGYSGPWIENHFISKFLDKPLSYFRGLIPLFVQWVDIHVVTFNETEKAHPTMSIPFNTHATLPKTIMDLLRPDVLYVAVNQDDQGLGRLTLNMPNVFSFSAGGYGHIPLPLIKGELPYQEPPSSGQWKSDVGFFGNPRPRLSRHQLLAEVRRQTTEMGMRGNFNPSPAWEQEIGKTKLNLSPRGYGRTSYRLAEVVQIGRIPVYMYDDMRWLPYIGTNASVEAFGFSSGRPFRAMVQAMAKCIKDPADFDKRMEAVKVSRKYYTYAGVMEQLELFFKDPMGKEGGLLGQCPCQRRPVKDHR